MEGKVTGKLHIMQAFCLLGICLAASCRTTETAEEFIEEPVYEGGSYEPAFGSPGSLKPVVRFSCASSETKREDELEAELAGDDDARKLSALASLLEVNAPSSVALQHKAFLELKESKLKDHPLIGSLARYFEPDRIRELIKRDPPAEKYADDRIEFYWGIRAAGVLKLEDCIPRLLELSDSANLDTFLAAERSVEDFEGEKAEDALMHIISLWRYNAYVSAAEAMLKRNPDRLSRELEKMTPPEDCRYQYGLFLAWCRNPKAVPHLCATVKDISIVDGSMFSFIKELGRPEDKAIIEALPDTVRPNQKDRAIRTVEGYQARMKASSE